MGLLLDSTALSRAERHRLTPEQTVQEIIERWGDVELAISAMSAGELFHGCWRAETPARRARREEFVEALLAAIPVIPVSLTVMRIFGAIDAQTAAAGVRLPRSDLIIACTVLSRGDAVLTGNARHFARVEGLTVHVWR